ncbi:hypothetical protein BKA69DRAFT_268102 [Paraphysoderma sedebokerense]|nr:hypothetical protein BKA69DRAFT_268102 [Paraphysoderma sedebokerense]
MMGQHPKKSKQTHLSNFFHRSNGGATSTTSSQTTSTASSTASSSTSYKSSSRANSFSKATSRSSSSTSTFTFASRKTSQCSSSASSATFGAGTTCRSSSSASATKTGSLDFLLNSQSYSSSSSSSESEANTEEPKDDCLFNDSERSDWDSGEEMENNSSNDELSGDCREDLEVENEDPEVRSGVCESENSSSSSTEVHVNSKRTKTKSPKKKATKKKRKILDSWFKEFEWLERVGENNDRLRCKCCTKFCNVATNSFAGQGTGNYKKDALRRHANSQQHMTAMRRYLGQTSIQQSTAVAEQIERQNVKTYYTALFDTAYTIGRIESSLENFVDLVKLQIKSQALKLTKSTLRKYQNRGACREMLIAIGDSLEADLIKEIKLSPYVSFIIDETTDISVSKQLIVYVAYLSENDVKIMFGKLLELDRGDAEHIKDKLIDLQEVSELIGRELLGWVLTVPA